MKITFLGTGTSQGVPIIGSDHPVCQSNDPRDKRLRVAVLLEWDNYSYVIDCGPDFRQQMIANDVKKIDGILFTHEHNDHIIGLDDVRPFYFRQGDISIYAHERVLSALKKRFEYIFQIENKYPGAPTLAVNEIENKPFSIGDKQVTPVNVWHGRLQVFAFRIDDFAYVTDAKSIDPEEKEKLKGVKTLVVNALRRDPHHSHFNLEEALAFIDEINPDEAYLTHISHLLGFHEEVERELPDHIHLAHDNLSIDVS